MPPHCDTMDGPVVRAAREALDSGNVNLILPFAPKTTEAELRQAFEKTEKIRPIGGEASDVADRWFFETAVRLHREGEGAPYTGLKPAGLDVGPVLPRAERSIEHEDATEVIRFLSQTVEEEVRKRMDKIVATEHFDPNDVDAAREHTEAVLDFELFSHHVYTFIKSGGGHGGGGEGSRAQAHEHEESIQARTVGSHSRHSQR